MDEQSRELVLKKNNLVTKANSLIEITYKLGVTEQKILLCIASNIKPSDKDFQTYTFSIKEFCKLIGSTSKNAYAEIDKITQKLMDKSFLIYNREGKPTRINWLSKATYNTNEGTITVRFDPDLKPFYLDLSEKFTRYKLENIIHLRSSNSIRIFELLKSYEGLSERTFTVDDLRNKLGLEGKYSTWNNFKQRVLQHAQKELEEKTDITFTFTPIRKGRVVEKVKFQIKANPSNQFIYNLDPKFEVIEVVKAAENPQVVEIYQTGLQLGITLSEGKICEWLESFEKENIIDAIRMAGMRRNIKHFVPYITKILVEQAKEVEETIQLEPKEQLIQELISEYTPKGITKKADPITEFLLRFDAVEKFAKIMSLEEATALWEDRKEDILLSINKNRESSLISNTRK